MRTDRATTFARAYKMFLLVWGVVVAVPATIAHAQPLLNFRPDRVIVSGVSPGASVALFSVGRERRSYSWRQNRVRTVISDDDRDGRVEYLATFPVHQQSIWAAIDLSAGTFSVAPSPGFWLTPMKTGRGAFGRGPDGMLRHVVLKRAFGEMILARPGVGAWALSVAEGGGEDTDGRSNGEVAASVRNFRSIKGGAPPPDAFRDGDIVLVIDPLELDYLSFVVGPPR